MRTIFMCLLIVWLAHIVKLGPIFCFLGCHDWGHLYMHFERGESPHTFGGFRTMRQCQRLGCDAIQEKEGVL